MMKVLSSLLIYLNYIFVPSCVVIYIVRPVCVLYLLPADGGSRVYGCVRPPAGSEHSEVRCYLRTDLTSL